MHHKQHPPQMNHINSYRRKKSFGKSAYDMTMGIFPNEYFKKLGLEKIPDDEIILQPLLLNRRLKLRTKVADYRPEHMKRK